MGRTKEFNASPQPENTEIEPIQCEIRDMEPDDLEFVIDLANNTSEFQVGNTTPDFYYKDTLIRMCNSSSDCIMLLAIIDDEPAGFIITKIHQASKDAEISTIAVSLHHRDRSVGTQLLEETLNRLNAPSCVANHVSLQVQDNNTVARKFFENKGGFTKSPTISTRFDLMLQK